MSYLQSILTKAEPLSSFERDELVGWLEVLEADVAMFGVAPEDEQRMDAIRKRLNEGTS
ncbi:hypothetical protein [Methyloceanibacter caenitepidi]|uniref:Uncharacterized protein n=1 Tax=Methyloceanibacter caenitepidi TaxID=1384459 RepID=A0A0A8K344_9HYPH|nr:hypothetical protein [Methyloceanibacter caenitepidi]BAQ16947.1 hypothetical protein GL4_1491 [Methyloceanibacter caenitepidi]